MAAVPTPPPIGSESLVNPRALQTYEFFPTMTYGIFVLIDKLIQDVGANNGQCDTVQVKGFPYAALLCCKKCH